MVDKPRFTHRTVNLSPPAAAQQFAKTLFGVLSKGVHGLPGIVAALKATELRPQDGGDWTEARFTAEVERLGAYPNSVGGPLGSHKPNIVPHGTSSSARMEGHDH